MTYTKIGFKDRIDSKPTSYIVDGKPLEISKDNAGLKQKGTSLNADNLNHMEDGIYQNSVEIERFNTELLTNKTKTVKENSNVVSLKDNIEGIANITIEGNTIDVNKEPIISDFKGKVKGSTAENPNVAKVCVDSKLQIPSDDWTKEFDNYYKDISSKDGKCNDDYYSGKKLGEIPQQLYTFDLIKIIEKEKGTIPGSSTKEKVEWLKKNIESITCNWWGYGECSTGNIAYLKPFKADESKWLEWGKATSTNVAKVTVPLLNVHYYINNDGFVSFLALTDASDGKTPSVIYTDYINLEVKLKTELQSVGEKEKQIEIKSVGKNLFNGVYENKYTDGGYPYCIQKSNETRTAFIRIQPGKTYYIKKYSKSNRLILGLYNSIDINSIPLLPLKDLGDDTMEGSITNNVNAKYLSVYVSNNNEKPKMQIEENTKPTEYEPYREDKVIIQLKEPLHAFKSIVKDTLNADGTVVRRIKQTVLNGTEKWVENKEWSKDSLIAFYCKLEDCLEKPNDTVNITNDTFDSYSVNEISKKPRSGMCLSPAKLLSIVIPKNTLQTQDAEGLQKWLKENHVTIFYELAKPIVENLGQPLNLKTFKDGQIVIDTDIVPYTIVDYPTNVSGRVSLLENAEKNLKNSLGGAWKSLLILADKDLKMKSISPLKTTTTEDLKNKINEIIGVWKDEHI